MTTYTAPHAAFNYESGFESNDGAVSLFYCDDHLQQIDNINPVVSDYEHDSPSDGLFYKDFLNFLVSHDSALIFEVSDDFASYIYCLPEILNNNALWQQWLTEYEAQFK